jgi:hypothetical protein
VALFCLVLTAIWLALLIYGIARQGPVESFEQALASVETLGPLQLMTYVNATFITVSATMLFAGLYVICRGEAPLWAAMGAAFVPVYSLLNLFAYTSQFTIVPHLVDLRPESDVLLAQMVQAWPGSAVNILNNLGYAVLGIPSIIFGAVLSRSDGSLRVGGILLALSGAASIVGIVGIAGRMAALELGSIVSGVLFLAALVPLSVTWLRGDTSGG